MPLSFFQLENALRRANQLGRRVYIVAGGTGTSTGSVLTGPAVMDQLDLDATGIARINPAAVLGWFDPGAASVDQFKKQ